MSSSTLPGSQHSEVCLSLQKCQIQKNKILSFYLLCDFLCLAFNVFLCSNRSFQIEQHESRVLRSSSVWLVFVLVLKVLLSHSVHTAVLLYDICLTSSREVDCIWRRRFTAVTALFAINRYATLASMSLQVIAGMYVPKSTIVRVNSLILNSSNHTDWLHGVVRCTLTKQLITSRCSYWRQMQRDKIFSKRIWRSWSIHFCG